VVWLRFSADGPRQRRNQKDSSAEEVNEDPSGKNAHNGFGRPGANDSVAFRLQAEDKAMQGSEQWETGRSTKVRAMADPTLRLLRIIGIGTFAGTIEKKYYSC
jgi:hypothetical protein